MMWIKVSDKLPEDLLNVLGYNPKISESGCRIGVVFYIKDTNEWANQPSYFTDCITHWMPLPQEPT